MSLIELTGEIKIIAKLRNVNQISNFVKSIINNRPLISSNLMKILPQKNTYIVSLMIIYSLSKSFFKINIS